LTTTEAMSLTIFEGHRDPPEIAGERTMAKTLPPLHPGEVLREEFLTPLNLSPGALAKAMGVPRTRIERIAAETTGITADTALRLGKALNTSAQLWLNLQCVYDLAIATKDIGKEVEKIEPVPELEAAHAA
jgi:addiction module HigA family antidote